MNEHLLKGDSLVENIVAPKACVAEPLILARWCCTRHEEMRCSKNYSGDSNLMNCCLEIHGNVRVENSHDEHYTVDVCTINY